MLKRDNQKLQVQFTMCIVLDGQLHFLYTLLLHLFYLLPILLINFKMLFFQIPQYEITPTVLLIKTVPDRLPSPFINRCSTEFVATIYAINDPVQNQISRHVQNF